MLYSRLFPYLISRILRSLFSLGEAFAVMVRKEWGTVIWSLHSRGAVSAGDFLVRSPVRWCGGWLERLCAGKEQGMECRSADLKAQGLEFKAWLCHHYLSILVFCGFCNKLTKTCDLKQCKFILSQSWRLVVWDQYHCTEIKVLQSFPSSTGFRAQSVASSSFPGLSAFLDLWLHHSNLQGYSTQIAVFCLDTVFFHVCFPTPSSL